MLQPYKYINKFNIKFNILFYPVQYKMLQLNKFSRLFSKQTYMHSSTNEDGGKHIKITSKSSRSNTTSDVIITDIYSLSPCVKGFTVKILDHNFSFEAGQWVDALIPGLSTVGGFSICSTPEELKEKREIILGIKKSEWPPAQWFYDECQVGSRLSLRVGGDFFLGSKVCGNLLLVAGGVGVNPIFSIFEHSARLKRQGLSTLGKVALLYSAKIEQDLLYKSLIDKTVHSLSESYSVNYFTTKTKSSENSIAYRRISVVDIENALRSFDREIISVYICGPPIMIEYLVGELSKCGISESNIYFEKWW